MHGRGQLKNKNTMTKQDVVSEIAKCTGYEKAVVSIVVEAFMEGVKKLDTQARRCFPSSIRHFRSKKSEALPTGAPLRYRIFRRHFARTPLRPIPQARPFRQRSSSPAGHCPRNASAAPPSAISLPATQARTPHGTTSGNAGTFARTAHLLFHRTLPFRVKKPSPATAPRRRDKPRPTGGGLRRRFPSWRGNFHGC